MLSERPATKTMTTDRRQQRLVFLLLVTICLSELGYLLVVALAPELSLAQSPLAAEWTWTSFPAQLLLLFPGIAPHRAVLAPLLLGLVLFMLTTIYTGAILGVQRLARNVFFARRWLWLLLGGTLIFSLTLFFQPTLFSDDVFTHIFSGRILAIYHADPLNTAPIQFPNDPYLKWIISGRYTPNIYGPLWYCISALLVSLHSGPVGTLLLFKGVAILAHLLNSVLVWVIVGRIAPGRQLLGTLLYTWNPLVLIELAGNGHNEGVLMLLLLLATWLSLQQKAGYRLGALLMFGLAMSMNLIVLLLAPLYIWFTVRTERSLLRALYGSCWRALVLAAPALLVWLPFWRGASTFFAVTSAIDMQHFIHSPVGTLTVPFHALFRFVADIMHFPPFLQPIPAANIGLRASATFVFALIYIGLFARIRHAPGTSVAPQHKADRDQDMPIPGLDVLLSAWGVALFAYLVLVSGLFWPWYMLWMLWIVPLRRLDALTSTVLVLSGTALFLYPFLAFAQAAVAPYQAALVFGIPLAYLVIARSWQRHRERTSPGYDR